MKVTIINRSDSTGGAAVVSRRLLEALRRQGVDARMLVCEKRHESPYVRVAGKGMRIRLSFLLERLGVFWANRLNRRLLFKVDPASHGLPLHRDQWVRDADVICLNWVNQGMLSLREIEKILQLGKPVVWTMHDMWNLTGICHHAGTCQGWKGSCGDCPQLGRGSSPHDLSARVWRRKRDLYRSPGGGKLHFVGVSNWVADMFRKAPLTEGVPVSVIPNPFAIPAEEMRKRKADGRFVVVMGAARLDDEVKGLPILVEATRFLATKYPEEAKRMELVTFGGVRDPEALSGIGVTHRHLGMVRGEEEVRKIYLDADAVVSASLYETLPTTLVEGQVYGCIPVSFGRGGQSDIIDHCSTGYIAQWSDDLHEASARLAEGLLWAMRESGPEIRRRMYESASGRFSSEVVARRYISLFESMLK